MLKAQPQTPVAEVLSPAVLRANPFMRGMTAAGLNERAHRDLDLRPDSVVAMPEIGAGSTRPAAGADGPKCNQGLASCRRWVALRAGKADPAKAITATKPGRGPIGRKVPAKTS